MAKPLGSKNKTPEELKIDAQIKLKQAEIKLLKQKQEKLAQERRV